MLSPGVYYKKVPKGLKENLEYRRGVILAARKDHALRKGLVAACRQDILFYINTFVWQFNPKSMDGTESAPFITWDFQDEAIRKILGCIYCTCHKAIRPHQHDLVIEKSREMGASWLCLLVMEWLWKFHKKRSQFLCISRDKPSVEDPSPDSLFWKLDYVHQHTPSWLMPKGWDVKKHRRSLFFRNPETGSTITGQASTGKAGVGGRAFVMFIDEFSQIDEDKEVLNRTSDTADCRIFNGTHKGVGTEFYNLTQRADMRKLQMHWSQHPLKKQGLYRFDAKKNQIEVLDKFYQYPAMYEFVRQELPAAGAFPGLRSPWYDEAVTRKGNKRGVAEDLDIDPGGSAGQFFDALAIRNLRAAYACDPLWQGDLEYDRDAGTPIRLIQRQGGAIKLWRMPRADDSIPPSDYTAGADISTGNGATNSCFTICDGRTGEKVLELATAALKPEHFAPLCLALCYLFKNEMGTPAKFAWEKAGPGLIFTEEVMSRAYPNCYYRTSHQILDGGKEAEIPGWVPQNKQKEILLEEYRIALESHRFLNKSDEALKECLYFYVDPANNNIYHSGERDTEDPSGARDNHGDRVIADALAWKMAKEMGRESEKKKKKEEAEPVGSLAWRARLSHNHRTERAWA